MNPLSVSGLSGNRTSSTLSNGNLTSTNPGSNAWNCRLATVGVDSGKWYYEYTVNGSISNFLGGWADSPNLNWTDAVGNTLEVMDITTLVMYETQTAILLLVLLIP